MLTVEMQSLEEPLLQEEMKKLRELMGSEPLLEKMVERAVSGMRKSGRIMRRASGPP
jgi:predicted phosphatase